MDLYTTSKWIKDKNIRAKNYKTRRRKCRGEPHDIGLGKTFLDITPKTQATKEKIDKFDFIKIKNFCASKDTTNEME